MNTAILNLKNITKTGKTLLFLLSFMLVAASLYSGIQNKSLFSKGPSAVIAEGEDGGDPDPGGGCGDCGEDTEGNDNDGASDGNGGDDDDDGEKKPLVCIPEYQVVSPFQNVNFEAKGGKGKYKWSAPGGNPSSGKGKTFTTQYPAIKATYKVTVQSGKKTAECGVYVIIPSPVPSPSVAPSPSPSTLPSPSPSLYPTPSPSLYPSPSPSVYPTPSPSLYPSPSVYPSPSPSVSPSASPSYAPSASPSAAPSVSPSASPSYTPSVSPSPSAYVAQCPANTYKTIQNSIIVCVAQNQGQDQHQSSNSSSSSSSDNNVEVNVNVTPQVLGVSTGPKVVGKSDIDATKLPETGLPLVGAGLASLLPIGLRLRKSGKGNDTEGLLSANDLWLQRQLKK